MAANQSNKVKLGVFVLAGLGFLVLLLYIIGKNQNLFGSTFSLKARFSNIHGLMPGNNIRFAGIDAGSVKHVEVLNDTTIEVVLMIKTKMKPFIRRNAAIRIGTDGLIGNRVVNIEPSKEPSPLVTEGEVLQGSGAPDTDEMLETLNQTTADVAAIALSLRNTMDRFNDSKVLWNLLEDPSLPATIKQSLARANAATMHLNKAMFDIALLIEDVKKGKGTVGKLMRDSTMFLAAEEAVEKIKNVGAVADSLSGQMGALVTSVSNDIHNGKGTVNALLKDEVMAQRLNNTIKNIEQDTESLSEVLEAVKQSFLFRGYFKKLERQKQNKASVPDY
jgi:phospholipid/cholesterol/gamma-HCH transport system substrate-binding protein